MARVSNSNVKYTGVYPTVNIIASASTDADKLKVLRSILYSNGNAPLTINSAVTEANAAQLMSALLAHSARVTADGGELLSVSNTITALAWAINAGVALTAINAYGAGLGVKRNGTLITKIYSLGSVPLDLTKVGATGDLTVAALASKKYAITSASAGCNFVSVTPNSGMPSIILGGSSNDVNASSGTSVTPALLGGNTALSGALIGVLRADNGNTTKYDYLTSTDVNSSLFRNTTGAGYLPYVGQTGIAGAGVVGKSYENGVLLASGNVTAKDLTAVTTYNGLGLASAGSFIAESWFIKSSDAAIAISLGKYLTGKFA